MPRQTIVCVHTIEVEGKEPKVAYVSAVSELGARQRFSVGEAAQRSLLGHDEFFVAGSVGEIEVTARVSEGGAVTLKALDADGADALLRAPRG